GDKVGIRGANRKAWAIGEYVAVRIDRVNGSALKRKDLAEGEAEARHVDRNLGRRSGGGLLVTATSPQKECHHQTTQNCQLPHETSPPPIWTCNSGQRFTWHKLDLEQNFQCRSDGACRASCRLHDFHSVELHLNVC